LLLISRSQNVCSDQPDIFAGINQLVDAASRPSDPRFECIPPRLTVRHRRYHAAQEYPMNRSFSLGLTMLAGVALGAAAITGLNAQTKPPAYAVINVSKMTDPEGFKAVLSSPGASPAELAALGGHYIIRTTTTAALDGIPPERFVVIAFDSKEKAQAWYDSPATKETNAIRRKTTQSTSFIVEGVAN
jgi:uncharacterized protein (DUF1330 family)